MHDKKPGTAFLALRHPYSISIYGKQASKCMDQEIKRRLRDGTMICITNST